ncbi:OX-2 membrane glycoprotein isoform X2 [Xenopus laevis]|uniref:OX-2 membrane glycoprotein isoform X2 n=1 Tax=Xenopus laevis TaxID=8355 RepID=A0A8J0UG04_XENLA|nr:OX-2 membrane glycoprotein isoform X2 [Xenopus laevis]
MRSSEFHGHGLDAETLQLYYIGYTSAAQSLSVTCYTPCRLTAITPCNMNLLNLFLLCSLTWNLTAGSQVMCSVDKRTVPVGGSVTMRCKLNLNINSPDSSDVLQVTWSKQSGDFAGTIATSSRTHGQRFLGPYSNRKVQFSEVTQDLSAITISSVTPGDQGCFQCIFSVYPLGSIMGSICLNVTVRISDPKLYINKSEEYHIISCSATGKPAPTITWNLTETPEQNPQNYSINHPDQTVTVISNFTHRTLGRIHVTCVVHHPSLSSDIVLSKSIEDSGVDTSGKKNKFVIKVSAVIIVVTLLCCLLAFIYPRWKRHKKYQGYGFDTETSQE